ncbi:MAG: hypothetical protein HYU28_12155 [Actinobacteria bacterium]|nr:hypothetical protein [Actinomycetota bacterium]
MEHPFGVVRGHRLELVDALGRVRIAAGETDGASPGFGLELFDARGRSRAWLLIDEGGPRLGLDYNGNTGIEAYVLEGPEAVGEGPRVAVCDRDGVPVLAWPAETQNDDEGQ